MNDAKTGDAALLLAPILMTEATEKPARASFEKLARNKKRTYVYGRGSAPGICFKPVFWCGRTPNALVARLTRTRLRSTAPVDGWSAKKARKPAERSSLNQEFGMRRNRRRSWQAR